MQPCSIGPHHLYGEFFHPGSGCPAVLFIHGWNSSTEAAVPYAQWFEERGIASLLVDLRGHGRSEGDVQSLTRKDWLDDAIAAFDFLCEQDIDPQRISVVGSSFGGYITAALTAHRNPQGVALRVPANYADTGFEQAQARRGPTADSLAIRALRDFHGDVLIVESGQDEVIPHWMVAEYADAVEAERLTYATMPEAPHTVSTEPQFREEYFGILSQWVQRPLKTA